MRMKYGFQIVKANKYCDTSELFIPEGLGNLYLMHINILFICLKSNIYYQIQEIKINLTEYMKCHAVWTLEFDF